MDDLSLFSVLSASISTSPYLNEATIPLLHYVISVKLYNLIASLLWKALSLFSVLWFPISPYHYLYRGTLLMLHYVIHVKLFSSITPLLWTICPCFLYSKLQFLQPSKYSYTPPLIHYVISVKLYN